MKAIKEQIGKRQGQRDDPAVKPTLEQAGSQAAITPRAPPCGPPLSPFSSAADRPSQAPVQPFRRKTAAREEFPDPFYRAAAPWPEETGLSRRVSLHSAPEPYWLPTRS